METPKEERSKKMFSKPQPWHVELAHVKLGIGKLVDALKSWVAVKELKLSYATGETVLISIYSHYGD